MARGVKMQKNRYRLPGSAIRQGSAVSLLFPRPCRLLKSESQMAKHRQSEKDEALSNVANDGTVIDQALRRKAIFWTIVFAIALIGGWILCEMFGEDLGNGERGFTLWQF